MPQRHFSFPTMAELAAYAAAHGRFVPVPLCPASSPARLTPRTGSTAGRESIRRRSLEARAADRGWS